MTRLTPSSYLRQHCPVEIGAAPEHKGHNYLVALGVGFGGAGVELYRDGVLIDSDQINTTGFRIDPATGKLDWKHALKSLALPLVVGLAVGIGFGYLAGLAFK
jgi:hypothetical protein